MLQSDTTIYQLSNLFNFSSASFFSTIFVTSWNQSLVYLQIHLNKSSKHEFGSFPGGQRSNFHQLLSLAKLNSPNRNCYHGISHILSILRRSCWNLRKTQDVIQEYDKISKLSKFFKILVRFLGCIRRVHLPELLNGIAVFLSICAFYNKCPSLTVARFSLFFFVRRQTSQWMMVHFLNRLSRQNKASRLSA